MLTYAFEARRMLRVACTPTHETRDRGPRLSGSAGDFEGILRAHRMAADWTTRNSARFAIVAADWPEVKERIAALLDRS